MLAEVRKIDEKTFGLFIGKAEIGRSKLQCDVQFHANYINTAIDHVIADAQQAAYHDGYEDGYRAGINYVAAGG